MVGLARIGGNMALRLLRGGHRDVAYDVPPGAVSSAGSHGAVPASSLTELVHALPQPRAVWLVLPQGEPTQSTLDALLPLLDTGDVLDGGNAKYKDTLARVPAFETSTSP